MSTFPLIPNAEAKEKRRSSFVNRVFLRRNSVRTAAATDAPVLESDGIVVIPTASINSADQTLKNALLYPGHEISFINFSGASQNLLSYDGTSLQIKSVTGAPVATYALENATSATTGRRKFKSIGGVWVHIP